MRDASQSSGKSFQNNKAKSSPEKKRKEAKELQWSFANCLRRSAVKSVAKILSHPTDPTVVSDQRKTNSFFALVKVVLLGCVIVAE